MSYAGFFVSVVRESPIPSVDIHDIWGHDWGHILRVPPFCFEDAPKNSFKDAPIMAKIIKPLSPVQIKNAKPQDKAYKLFDGGGLYLEVFPTGSKLWRMKFRQASGKESRLAFGSYPEVSLEQARRKREEVRKLKAEGIDPAEKRKEQQAAKQAQVEAVRVQDENTFEKVARRLHASKQGRTSEDYRNTMLRQFELHLFPSIGQKHMADLEGKELFELFKSIADKMNSRGKPMTYMAKKLCQWSAEVYDLANVENSGFNLNNPCRSIIKFLPKHETEHMARIGFDELPQFIQALQNYGGHVLTRAAIWMLLYTGMRQTSVRHAQWSDFDLDKGIWNRKPEKSDRDVHMIPLPVQAVKLLHDIRPLTEGNPARLVFPSVFAGQLKMSEAAVGQAIERMGFAMTGHGLRGVVSTGLNELGFSPRLVEVQLGHKKGDAIEAAYNDAKHLNDRLKMMQKWADYLEEMKTGKLVTLRSKTV